MTPVWLTKGARVRCIKGDGFAEAGMTGTVNQNSAGPYLTVSLIRIFWDDESSSAVPVGSIEVISGKET